MSGEKFDGCASSECEMVYTTGDEPVAIAELRRRVAYAKEMNEQFPTLGNNKLGIFLTNILQEYDKVVEELEWTRNLVRMAYYEGAEDNDFNRELELVHYELGKTPYTRLPEGKYTWEASNVKRLLDER
jgi:hypothetical protein